MSESRPSIPFVIYDADGRIDMDLPCRKCGYNLRTLHDDRNCPECGASVYESARLSRLCGYDQAWLRRLARSTTWLQIAMICFALILSCLLALTAPRADDAIVVLLPLLVAGPVAGLVGFCQFTAPHRGGGIHWERARQIARWLMAAGLACVFLTLLADLLRMPRWVLIFSIPCSIVCLGMGAWATLTYATTLTAKIPDARLVKQLRIVAWGLALCFPLMTAGIRTDATITIVVTSWVALLLLSIWAILLLTWYRRRFREALAMSQQFAEGQAAHPAQ